MASKYFHPTTQKVMSAHESLVTWLKTTSDWRKSIDNHIQSASNGQLKVIQTFFENPIEVVSGTFVLQALRESDIQQMYPDLADQIHSTLAKNPNLYAYLFACNNAVFDDHGGTPSALVSLTFIN